jgi:hypothetical protein
MKNQWTRTPPTETDWHWYCNPEAYDQPYPVFLEQDRKTGKCFIPKGQIGLDRIIPCEELEGFWMKLETPTAPALIAPFQPVTIAVDIHTLRNIKDALATGEQHARDALTGHDASLGRTTLKNKRWVESMESDIGQLAGYQVIIEKLIGDH